MKQFSQTNYEHCFEMLRRFIGTFDVEASKWLNDNVLLVEDFMVKNLDRLTAPERLKLYVILFGSFRKIYKRVIDVRLQIENDPQCKKVLMVIEEEHRVAIQKPYSPVTEADLLAGCEKNLQADDAGLRYVGALGIWTLTKDSAKIFPILRLILENRKGEAREDAARLLGEVGTLDEDTIRALRTVADDVTDPVRLLAREALSTHA
jgi:hypothetical protein